MIAVGSRAPMIDAERIEALLKIFAVRAAGEFERQRSIEQLRRSEASYRTIFDAAKDAIYVYDWESLALLDVNQRACDDSACSREELLQAGVDSAASGHGADLLDCVRPHLQHARLDRCPPFEWLGRDKRGAPLCYEMHLKPVLLDDRRRILAFARNITERKCGRDEASRERRTSTARSSTRQRTR